MSRHDDSGAALILAIAFVLMVGAISAGLAGLATSSLNNRGALQNLRNRQYSAEGTVEDAITRVRALAGSPLTLCAASGGSIVDTLNKVAIRVDWRNACGVVQSTDGSVVLQRDVVFSACLSTGSACTEPGVIVRSQVNFEQATTGVVTRVSTQTWSTR